VIAFAASSCHFSSRITIQLELAAIRSALETSSPTSSYLHDSSRFAAAVFHAFACMALPLLLPFRPLDRADRGTPCDSTN
jgi:hypothetical protein